MSSPSVVVALVVYLADVDVDAVVPEIVDYGAAFMQQIVRFTASASSGGVLVGCVIHDIPMDVTANMTVRTVTVTVAVQWCRSSCLCLVTAESSCSAVCDARVLFAHRCRGACCTTCVRARLSLLRLLCCS